MFCVFSSAIAMANGFSCISRFNETIAAIGFQGIFAGILDAIYSSCYVIALYNTYTINVFIILVGVSLVTKCIFYFMFDDYLSHTTALLTIIYVIVVAYLTYDGTIGSHNKIW